MFKRFKEFQEIKNKVVKVGAITAEQFFKFLNKTIIIYQLKMTE